MILTFRVSISIPIILVAIFLSRLLSFLITFNILVNTSLSSAASNGEDFYIVWSNWGDLYGTRMTSTGTLLDPTGVLISTENSAHRLPYITYSAESNQYFVTWFNRLSSDYFQ